ncbi:hypothetical protein [Clostridium beijerinckii]|nr:hypothetical protein [Clostridium beijerinckii]NRT76311.1 hypothetical protein [Clostridium beijerinckii]OOM48652.1 hypothetical protein CBEIJ_21240 [Clostridium beijerinckii]
MKIGENEIGSIIIAKDNEVVAIITDKEIVEKDDYKVIIEPVQK